MYKVSPKPKRTIPIKTYFNQYIVAVVVVTKDNGTVDMDVVGMDVVGMDVVGNILFGDIRKLFFMLLKGPDEMGADEIGPEADEMGPEADEIGSDEIGSDEIGANESLVGAEENNLDTEFFILPNIELDLGLGPGLGLGLRLGLGLLYGCTDFDERDREVILYIIYK
jgi:hypothetical protein